MCLRDYYLHVVKVCGGFCCKCFIFSPANIDNIVFLVSQTFSASQMGGFTLFLSILLIVNLISIIIIKGLDKIVTVLRYCMLIFNHISHSVHLKKHWHTHYFENNC